MRKLLASVVLLLGFMIGACGTSITPDFPNRILDAQGNALVLEDLQAIVDDPGLSEDAKRQAFRDLGILDEHLIDALLDL